MQNVLYQFIEFFFCLNLHTDQLDQGQLGLEFRLSLLEVGLSSASR